MTDCQALLQLADRCEAATGPDRELDRDIGATVGRVAHDGIVIAAGYVGVGSFTSSIDAAIRLTPNGHMNPSDIVRGALARLGERFSLHIMHWPVITPYHEWLARFVAASALRALAHASTGDTT